MIAVSIVSARDSIYTNFPNARKECNKNEESWLQVEISI